MISFCLSWTISENILVTINIITWTIAENLACWCMQWKDKYFVKIFKSSSNPKYNVGTGISGCVSSYWNYFLKVSCSLISTNKYMVMWNWFPESLEYDNKHTRSSLRLNDICCLVYTFNIHLISFKNKAIFSYTFIFSMAKNNHL